MDNAELDRLVKNVLEARKAFVAALRSDPQVVDASTFSFTEGGVPRNLADFFGDQDDLIVIHNMGKSCVYCTLWADGLNGAIDHLKSRSALVLMNRDKTETQNDFAKERGWKYRMIRDEDGAFTLLMGFASQEGNKISLMPGYSTFHRDSDGTITRVGFDYFGPGDVYMPVFPMLELLHDPDAKWEPQYSYHKPITVSLPDVT